MGAFVIAMVEHDRITAFEAFEQALAISPSYPLTLFLGGLALAYGCEAERAIDWAERALEIFPAPWERVQLRSDEVWHR
jgi:tetratricopeptide (TPR) repeat protein